MLAGTTGGRPEITEVDRNCNQDGYGINHQNYEPLTHEQKMRTNVRTARGGGSGKLIERRSPKYSPLEGLPFRAPAAKFDRNRKSHQR